MQCSKCRKDALVFQPYSGQHLCRDHFIIDFEAKAKRTIRKNCWMRPGDHIAVVLTGSAADGALLYFFEKLAGKRRDIRFEGVMLQGALSSFIRNARNADYTKIALATSLEEASAALLTGIVRGQAGVLFGKKSEDVPVITPFCHIPAEEVMTYAEIHGIAGTPPPVQREDDTLYSDIAKLLAGYSGRHPGAPYAILNLKEELECRGPDDRPGQGQ